MRALLVALAAAAVLLGGAGGATLALERRLAVLAPGGVEIATLRYNPFSGRLVLAGVRARDADGRELFAADRLAAHARPLPLLVGTLALTRVRVDAPRITLRSLDARAADPLLRLEDLAVTGGLVVVEDHGAGRPPLRAHDLDLRLGRLSTTAAGRSDVAFVVETAIHVRARGFDVVALARDFPGRGFDGLQKGRGEVDASRTATEPR